MTCLRCANQYPLTMFEIAANAAASSVDPLFALLFGALGASVLGLIGGAIGAWVQSRREHRRWLRDQKLAAYTTVLDLTSRLQIIRPAARDDDQIDGDLFALFRATASVDLFGPDALAQHVFDLRNAAVALVVDMRNEGRRDGLQEEGVTTNLWLTNLDSLLVVRTQVILAARKELGIKS